MLPSPSFLIILVLFLIACNAGKNPYYQDNLVEITGQECNLADVCTYTIDYQGTELTVPEEEIEWK